MASSKRKRQRLVEGRLARARQLAESDTTDPDGVLPPGALAADPEQLRHNNTHGPLPRFYADQVVACRRCGALEVWFAERQKWWYEVAKGDINSRAVLCRGCRAAERRRKEEARRAHLEGLARKREQE